MLLFIFTEDSFEEKLFSTLHYNIYKIGCSYYTLGLFYLYNLISDYIFSFTIPSFSFKSTFLRFEP